MDLFQAMQISASGLTAQRVRMNILASNLANANTTKTPEGGLGLALMRLDALEGGAEGKAFTAADVPLKVVKPAWAAF